MDPITKLIIENNSRQIITSEMIDILKEGKYEDLANWLRDASTRQQYGSTPIPGGKIGQTIKFGLLAAAIIAAGIVVYKKYYSKAAKACSGRTDKDACMKKYKKDAIRAQIKILTSNKAKCSKSNDKQKCVDKINKELKKLKIKEAKL